jgi:hypothetical protein
MTDPCPPENRSPLEHERDDLTPERIWTNGFDYTSKPTHNDGTTEYIRADFAAAEAVALRAKLDEAVNVFAFIESISVHIGGEIHGVTAMHWQQAMELAQRAASDARARITEGEG